MKPKTIYKYQWKRYNKDFYFLDWLLRFGIDRDKLRKSDFNEDNLDKLRNPLSLKFIRKEIADENIYSLVPYDIYDDDINPYPARNQFVYIVTHKNISHIHPLILDNRIEMSKKSLIKEGEFLTLIRHMVINESGYLYDVEKTKYIVIANIEWHKTWKSFEWYLRIYEVNDFTFPRRLRLEREIISEEIWQELKQDNIKKDKAGYIEHEARMRLLLNKGNVKKSINDIRSNQVYNNDTWNNKIKIELSDYGTLEKRIRALAKA